MKIATSLGKYVSKNEVEKILRSTVDLDPKIQLNQDELKANYNQTPFKFEHSLANEPIFELDKLLDLCLRLPEKNIKYRTGHIPKEADFDTSFSKYGENLSLKEVTKQFEENSAYIAIYNPEIDSEYGPAIDELLGLIGNQLRKLDKIITWYSAYIFLSTQNSVTPYHMDREMNFLFQIRGNKEAKLWRRFDYKVFPPALQDQVIGNMGVRKPAYESYFEDTALEFSMEPGTGIHIPYLAPHMVYTHSDVSVSLALTFRTQRSNIWHDAHFLNHRIRRLGLNPAPVGRTPVRDTCKAITSRVLRYLWSIVRKFR